MAALQSHPPLSAMDLVDQLAVRCLFTAPKTARNERSALTEKFRGDQDEDAVATLKSLDLDALRDRGLSLSRAWLEHLCMEGDPPSPSSVERTRRRAEKRALKMIRTADKQAHEDVRHDKFGHAELAGMVAATYAASVAARALPADSAIIADLAGIDRALLREARQNAAHRKAQNRDRPLADWLRVADLLAPEIGRADDLWETSPPPIGRIARAIWLATLCVGVRPIEWPYSVLCFVSSGDRIKKRVFEHPQEAEEWRSTWYLAVKNSKVRADMDPPARPQREIHIGALPRDMQDAIFCASMAVEAEIADDPKRWRSLMTMVGRRIASVARQAGFEAGLTIYDARHYLAFRVKPVLDEFEVAALMGHSNIASSGAYGAQVDKRPPRLDRPIPADRLAELGVAAPTQNNVEFVFRRTAKMRGWDVDPNPPAAPAAPVTEKARSENQD